MVLGKLANANGEDTRIIRSGVDAYLHKSLGVCVVIRKAMNVFLLSYANYLDYTSFESANNKTLFSEARASS